MRRRPGQDADPVSDQRVAGEDEEQQHALEHLGGLVGDPELDLRRLAPEVADAEQHAGEQHPDRIQSAEKSHDDRGEAIAG